uniref:Uncharacterized protein n=1 Tax=Hordeum vulgare subsp. vulgare TaxID=112509 RepID=A0A8I7BD43_HORVV
MFLCRLLVSPPLSRALSAAAPVSMHRLASWSSTSLRVVRCMAREQQIQRELAYMLTRDPVMQHTVLPKAALGADRCARCKCPCLGMRGGKKVAMSGLKDKTKY